jgi:hypothetical protein
MNRTRIALRANVKSVRLAPAGREGCQAAPAVDVILMG